MSSFKKQVLFGTLWTVVGQILTVGIVLLTNILLTRMLSPKDFGQVGVVMFFVVISNVLVEGGFGGALVRKKEVSKIDYSTVFVINLFVSLVCYGILLIFCKQIGVFYRDPEIGKLLKVIGVVLIFNAFQITQNAKLIREMRFKQKNIYRFFSVFLASLLGVFMAYNGAGVWALVSIQIATVILLTVILWIFEGFFFDLRFSKDSFRSLYSFGINTTVASLLNTGFDNIYQLILGRYFSLSQVGLFYQAKKLQDVPGNLINMLSQSVLFSALSKKQDDKIAFASIYNRIILIFTVGMGLLTIVIFVYAEEIIQLLYGDRWLGAVLYMKILTIASFFYLQETVNRIIFKVFDQTKKILYLEFLKKAIQTVSIIIGVISMNLEILIIGFVITNFISCLINYYHSRKILAQDSMYEFFVLMKICVISAICIFVIQFANIKFLGKDQFQWVFLPALIILYLGLLQLFKIFSIKKEFNALKRILVSRS